MYVDLEDIERFILDADLVSRDDVEEALRDAESSGATLGDVLVKKGLITPDDWRRVESYSLGIPFVNLRSEPLDFSILSIIPEPLSRNHGVVAFKREGEDLEVALLDLEALSHINFLQSKLGVKILPRFTDEASIKHALSEYHKVLKTEFGDAIEREANILSSTPDADIREHVSIARIVDTLVKHALLQGVSDIHIDPQGQKTSVRYRINGVLHQAITLPDLSRALATRLKQLANLDVEESSVPQTGQFRAITDSEKVGFRVSIVPTTSGEKVNIHISRGSESGFSLESLGFQGENLDMVHKAIKQGSGLVVVSGREESGKTTTLYTMLDALNTPRRAISTIEDPVEYKMHGVSQTSVQERRGLTYTEGLRSILRQDPDVVMVGNLQDKSVARLASRSGLRGHLIIASLEAPNTSKVIEKMLSMGIEPELLASSLSLITSQKLLQTLPKERTKYFLSEQEVVKLSRIVNLERMLEAFRAEGVIGPNDKWDKVPFYKCDKESGEKIAATEVLNITPSIRELVSQGASSKKIEEEARAEGMLTMTEDAVLKAAQGYTSLDEVYRTV